MHGREASSRQAAFGISALWHWYDCGEIGMSMSWSEDLKAASQNWPRPLRVA